MMKRKAKLQSSNKFEFVEDSTLYLPNFQTIDELVHDLLNK